MSKRYEEIAEQYLVAIQKHVSDVVKGKTLEFMELNEIASSLAVSHKHLIDVMQKTNGHHPCYFYDAEIIFHAKRLLLSTDKSIAEIARNLTYDPSNFSKFFKSKTGETPGSFRKKHK